MYKKILPITILASSLFITSCTQFEDKFKDPKTAVWVQKVDSSNRQSFFNIIEDSQQNIITTGHSTDSVKLNVTKRDSKGELIVERIFDKKPYVGKDLIEIESDYLIIGQRFVENDVFAFVLKLDKDLKNEVFIDFPHKMHNVFKIIESNEKYLVINTDNKSKSNILVLDHNLKELDFINFEGKITDIISKNNKLEVLVVKDDADSYLQTLNSDFEIEKELLLEAIQAQQILQYQDEIIIIGTQKIDAESEIKIIKVNNKSTESVKILNRKGNEHVQDAVLFNNNIYISGNADEENGNKDIYLCKVSANGELLWEEIYGYLGDDVGMAITSTKDGGAVALGVSIPIAKGTESILAKFK